jgi:Tfp pilus assembly protein PilX
MQRRNKNEKGVALILVLILLAVLSVMAVSLMFVGQSETWASMNYRMMTQTRYGAEAGIYKAADYIENTYAVPTTAQMASFYTTVSPVASGSVTGPPIILSANNGQPANYPVSAVSTDFASQTTGTITAGNTTITYAPYAKLLAMQSFSSYPTGASAVVQKWEITSDGTISGVRNGQATVSAILERQKASTFAYAAFADATGCAALSFGGGGTTNSYDSSSLTTNSSGVATAPASFSTYGGNVGTNGNLDESGSTTTINGTLSTPRTGTGSCSTSTVTALTTNGNANVTGGLVELPQNVTYDTPPTPIPAPTNTAMTVANNNPSCTNFPAQCSALPAANPTALYITAGAEGSGSNPAANATLLGAVTIQGDLHLVPPAGTLQGAKVYINAYSLTSNGNGNIYIDPIPGTNPAQYAEIVVNVAPAGTIDLTGGSTLNPSLVPANFQVLYGGTNQVKVNGGAQNAMLIYAPNASFKLNGGADLYGAVIANQIADLGGGAIHYDRKLQKQFYSLGNYMLSSFNWQKY